MTFNINYWDRTVKDPYHWKVVYLGPKNTPYEGGVFTVEVDLKNYPDSRPGFFFKTRIYHLNIKWLNENDDGHVCFGNTQTNDVKQLLKLVETYFFFQNPDSTWYGNEDRQAYRDFRDGKNDTFCKKAKEWVHLYAGLNKLGKMS